MRQRVIDLRTRGWTWERIEDALGVARTTAQSIVARQDAEGHASKKPRRGNHKAATTAVRDCVVSAQEHDAVLRLQDLAAEVQHTLHVAAPSLSTISRILTRAGFTTKKLERYANDRSTPETKHVRVGTAL